LPTKYAASQIDEICISMGVFKLTNGSGTSRSRATLKDHRYVFMDSIRSL
jgi:hypothetical protein